MGGGSGQEPVNLQAAHAYGLALPLHRPMLLNAAHLAAIPSHLRWALWAWRGRARATLAFSRRIQLGLARAALARLRVAAAEATAREVAGDLVAAAAARRKAAGSVLLWRTQTRNALRAEALAPIISRASAAAAAAVRTVVTRWAAVTRRGRRLREAGLHVFRRKQMRNIFWVLSSLRRAVRAAKAGRAAAVSLLLARWRSGAAAIAHRREAVRDALLLLFTARKRRHLARWRSGAAVAAGSRARCGAARDAALAKVQRGAAPIRLKWRAFSAARVAAARAEGHWAARVTARALRLWRATKTATARAEAAVRLQHLDFTLRKWREKTLLKIIFRRNTEKIGFRALARRAAAAGCALQRWSQLTAAQRSARAKFINAAAALRALSLARAVAAWRCGRGLVVSCRATRSLARCAVLRRTMRAWRVARAGAQGERVRTQLATCHAASALSLHACSTVRRWCLVAAARVVTRVAALTATRRLFVSRACRIVAAWRVAAKAVARSRALFLLRQSWVSKQLLRGARVCIGAWTRGASKRVAARAAAAKASSDLLHRRVIRGISFWRKTLAYSKAEDAVHLRTGRRAKRRAMLAWRRGAIASGEARERNSKVVAARIARVLTFWRNSCREKLSESVRITAFMSRRAARAAVTLLRTWATAAAAVRAQRAKRASAAAASHRARARDALHVWRSDSALAARIRRGAQLLGIRLAEVERARCLHTHWALLRAGVEANQSSRARVAAAGAALLRRRAFFAVAAWRERTKLWHLAASAVSAHAGTGRRRALAALRVWQLVSHRGSMTRKTETAGAVLRASISTRRVSDALRSWRACSRSRLELENTSGLWARRTCIRALARWQTAAQCRITARSSVTRASAYLVVRAWAARAHASAAARKRRALAATSALARTARAAVSALVVWRCASERGRRSRLLTSAAAFAACTRADALAARMLRAWSVHVIAARARRNILVHVSRRVARSHARAQAARALSVWSRRVGAFKTAIALQTRIQREWLAAAFRGLAGYAARRRRAREVAGRAPDVLETARARRLAARGLFMWRRNAGHRARAAREQRVAVLSKAWITWGVYVSRRRVRAAAQASGLLLTAATRQRLAAHVFAHWRAAAEADRVVRLACAQRAARVAKRVLRAWEAFSLSRAKERFEANRLTLAFRVFSVGRGLERWRDALAARVARRKQCVIARAHVRRKVLGRALAALALASLRSRAIAARVHALRVLRLERSLLAFLSLWQWLAVRARVRARRLLEFYWQRWRLRILIGKARRLALASVLARLALAQWARATLTPREVMAVPLAVAVG